MSTELISEQGKEIYYKQGRFLRGLALVENRFSWKDIKNIKNKIEEGPNIIVANHPGAHKDIAVLTTLYKRQLFFTANKEVLNKKDFDRLIKNYIKKRVRKFFGIFGTAFSNNVNVALTLPRYFFVKHVPYWIKETGSIPFNIGGIGNKKARSIAEKYLRNDLPVVYLQYHGKKKRSKYALDNQDIYEFKYGAFKLAYDMWDKYKEKVPVTPISIEGSDGIFRPFKRIKINFGEPGYITDYLDKENLDKKKSVAAFKESLEKKVVRLYEDSVKKDKIIYPEQPPQQNPSPPSL